MALTLEDVRTNCGHRYIPYDRQRVETLIARLQTMVDEQGLPNSVHWSPDIAHQLVDWKTDEMPGVLKNVATKCDGDLPPDTIVFR